MGKTEVIFARLKLCQYVLLSAMITVLKIVADARIFFAAAAALAH